MHDNALPLIVTHGWPGSVIEQLKIIDPLVNPTSHGASASDAFHLVIPSMPGYGFSGKPTTTGWGPERIARAWAEPGIHTNMAGAVPPDIDKAAFTGAPPPPGLSAEERRAYDQLASFYKHDLAYAPEMGSRPQTLYGIADSPVGLAAWILDHDTPSLELTARVLDGRSEGLTRDDVLVLPDDIDAPPRSWPGRAYRNLIHYHKLDKGGHFAAWEQPTLFSEEVRAGFRSPRK